MMGVTPGYSAQLKKTDCRVAQLRMRNVLVMTTAACAIAGLSACSPVPDLPPAPATPAPGTGTSATSNRIASRSATCWPSGSC